MMRGSGGTVAAPRVPHVLAGESQFGQVVKENVG